MEYVFSWGWFLFGLAVLAGGVALVAWYRPIADNIGGGVSSYERYRLWGLIACIVGVLFMLNIHTLLLRLVFSSFFGGGQ